MKQRNLKKAPPTTPSRCTILLRAASLYLVLCATLRIVLLAREETQVDLSPLSLLPMFAIGVWFDLATLGWLGLPIGLYYWLAPDRLRASRFGKLVGLVGTFAFLSVVVFALSAEWFFWDEFSVRFNFIAVDYLVYTTEVIGNIHESYPLPTLFSAAGLVSLALTWLVARRPKPKPIEPKSSRLRTRSAWALAGAVALLVLTAVSSGEQRQYSKNSYNNELAGNGVFQLFSAYLNNELDYESFYPKVDEDLISGRLQTLLDTSHSDERGPTWNTPVVSKPEMRKNVMFVAVESFSGNFLETFGNTEGLTPSLDALVDQSLFFDNLYATGTRTVRGLEALSLSLPPTPGQSIVRRPDHSDLYTIGTPFQSRGYDVSFLYGGYGYFDNMNVFFADNGFKTVDRTDLSEEEVGFANIWGVADEYLFNRALVEADLSVAAGKNFFQLVLTTSNHRPFTYPDGRIDIPSPGSREGAVKYTDWAIGNFLKQARQHAWFKDTLFVIVADHCHASAGKTYLPVHRYHIPAWFYAPGFIEPRRVDTLISQIDLAPTIFGLLGFPDDTPFFGRDVFSDQHASRVFISTYQLLGLIEGDRLAILEPGPASESFRILDFAAGEVEALGARANDSVVENAITYYQGASYAYENHLLSPSRVSSTQP